MTHDAAEQRSVIEKFYLAPNGVRSGIFHDQAHTAQRLVVNLELRSGPFVHDSEASSSPAGTLLPNHTAGGLIGASNGDAWVANDGIDRHP